MSQHDRQLDGRVGTTQPKWSLLYPAQSGTYCSPTTAFGFQHEPPLTRSRYTGDPYFFGLT